MSATTAIILWVVVLIASKVAQVWYFPKYRKTWKTWDRHIDPVGIKLIRRHPFHELGWYGVAALSAVLFFSLIRV